MEENKKSFKGYVLWVTNQAHFLGFKLLCKKGKQDADSLVKKDIIEEYIRIFLGL